MSKREYPRLVWAIHHLPDIVLFLLVLPLALVALTLHFL